MNEQPNQPQHPATGDPAAWRAFLQALGIAWRTELEQGTQVCTAPRQLGRLMREATYRDGVQPSRRAYLQGGFLLQGTGGVAGSTVPGRYLGIAPDSDCAEMPG
jgi:hypothetical protein